MVKSGGFHEILGHSPHPAFIKLKSFCWNTCFYNLGWISQVKSGWNPPDFTGEIHQISGWNLVDFKGEIPHPAFIKLKSFCWNTCFYNFGWISQVKSTRFHRWNPPDFKVKSPTLHSSNWRVFAETLAFIILGGFHRWYLGEIRWISWILRISWNPPDPPDFTDFMDFMKSARFHGWNPPDFTMKSARFHGFHEIRRILWNPLDLTDFTDFMKSAGFHGWNPPDFTDFTDFTGEIHRISRISWNPYEIRRISWTWAFGWWSSIGLSIERPMIPQTQ